MRKKQKGLTLLGLIDLLIVAVIVYILSVFIHRGAEVKDPNSCPMVNPEKSVDQPTISK
jgi:hypothetical protein